MSKHETFTVTRHAGYHLAAVYDSFCRIEAAESQARKVLGQESFHARLEAGHNHWLAGALFFSSQVQEAVDRMIDFERWDLGVFSYEHLEFNETNGIDGCKSLPAELWRKMSLNQWNDIACEHLPAGAEWLEQSVRLWAQELKLPLVEDRDEGLSPDQLEAKYGPGHPEFTRLKWKDAVCLDTTDAGYWAWVSAEVSA